MKKKETKKYLYISGSVQKPLKLRFLLPRQVTLAVRRRKNFSLGREQMWTPQPPLGERGEEKSASEKTLYFCQSMECDAPRIKKTPRMN